MSAEHILEQARALGIVLSASDGRLRYEAATGRLTPDLRQALAIHKAAILDLLEVERLSSRRIVFCRDCEHYRATEPIRRPSGAIWEMPGNCAQGRTSWDGKPPIYPFTGWYCESWMPRRLQ
jgi:hypothetical protein